MMDKKINLRKATKEDLEKLNDFFDNFDPDLSDDPECNESKERSAKSLAALIRMTCAADPENGPDIVANKVIEVMDEAIITSTRKTLKMAFSAQGYVPSESDEDE